MSKKRKHGAPKKTPAKARANTHHEEQLQNLHHLVVHAGTAEDIEAATNLLLGDKDNEEERLIIMLHAIARPGDDPADPQERKVRINTLTKETQIFKRSRGSSAPWQLEEKPR